MFGFYIRLTGRPANWIAGSTFLVIGAATAIWLPRLVMPGPQAGMPILVLHLLGGAFLAFGGLILAWMGGDVYLKFRHPQKRDAWYEQGRLLTSLVAAGMFAFPASLAFPVLFLAYLYRPNAAFPAGGPPASGNLLIGGLFSVLGVIVLGVMIYLLRSARSHGRRARRHKSS